MSTEINNKDNSSELLLCGGTNSDNGAWLSLHGSESDNGYFALTAYNGSEGCSLQGGIDGTLYWGVRKVECVADSNDNYIRYANGLQICWGSVIADNCIETLVSLPVSFNDKNYKVITTVECSNTSSLFNTPTVGVYLNSTSEFSIGQSNKSNNTVSISWVAVGKWK